jgi:lipoate-protein ligase A
MLCINSPITDPYYQIATEEYLLKNSGDEFFMLWKSDPVVVSGKHQNVLSEINYRYVQESGIRIARRLTGGGTVYHDHGNLNFTFIQKGEPGKLVDFSRFLVPVIAYLNNRGLPALQGPKHEILVNDLKVSGNAEHVYKNRILHHGTLLYHTDLNTLRKSILRTGGEYTDKAVQSNRASVANLSEYFHGKVNVEEFRNDFFDFMVKTFQGEITTLSIAQNDEVNLLAEKKFRNPDWIFGWSPDYAFKNNFRAGNKSLSITLATHGGKVVDVKLESPEITGDILEWVKNELIGKLHTEQQVRQILSKAGLDQWVEQTDFEHLVYAFF